MKVSTWRRGRGEGATWAVNKKVSIVSGSQGESKSGNQRLTLFLALDGRVSPLPRRLISKQENESKLEVRKAFDAWDAYLGDTSRFGGRTDGDHLVILSVADYVSLDLVRPSFVVIIMQTPQDVMILFIAHDHIVIAFTVILFVFVAIDGR
jgi:hypothetical protein